MKLLFENWRKYLNEEHVNESAGLVDFIIRSNQIEGYDLDPEEVNAAVEGRLEGYPLTYITQNPHIFSHLAGIDAAKKGHQTVDDIRNVHRSMGPDALEAGAPGVLRSGVEAQSAAGTEYVLSAHVPDALTWWSNQTWNDPFEAHTVYELIHPFADGNGRSGRIILAAMLGFNYPTVNNLIDENYFSNLETVGNKYQGEFWKQDHGEEVNEVIEKEGEEHCVKSPDNPNWSGGCYPSKKSAQKRKNQVEYFKHVK
jgi:Fic family protein